METEMSVTDHPGAALPVRWEPPENDTEGTAWLPLIPDYIERSRQALAVMEYAEDAVDAERRAAKLASYAKLAEWPTDIINEATLLRAEALVRASELVDEGQERGEIATSGRPGKLSEVRTVSELGIDRRRVAEGRKIRESGALDIARERIARRPDKPLAFSTLVESERRKVQRRAMMRANARAREAAKIELPEHDFYVCSCADLARHVEPASVDVVICDPPYPKKYLNAYSELAAFAEHALKPGGLVLAMAGLTYVLDVTDRLRERLTYQWTISYTWADMATQVWGRRVNSRWKPVLVFSNGPRPDGAYWYGDVVVSGQSESGVLHKWGQSESGVEKLVLDHSRPGDLVADPFLGSGTVAVIALFEGRRVVGCDIEVEWVTKTLERLGAGA
jgi:DNA methylase